MGWISWVTNVDPPSTIFYAEYQNTGPGSSVDGRVKWAGYKPTLTVDDAIKFTVESFIQGSEWLPDTEVKYDESLWSEQWVQLASNSKIKIWKSYSLLSKEWIRFFFFDTLKIGFVVGMSQMSYTEFIFLIITFF